MFQTNAQKDIDSCYVIMIRTNQRRLYLNKNGQKLRYHKVMRSFLF